MQRIEMMPSGPTPTPASVPGSMSMSMSMSMSASPTNSSRMGDTNPSTTPNTNVNTINNNTTTSTTTTTTQNRPDRPCDACRRRKSRCVFNSPDSPSCVLCDFHNQNCTFDEQPAPRKRKAPPTNSVEAPARLKRVSSDGAQNPRRTSESSIRTGPVIDDYANLQGESLLKKTLGLQNHRHARYIGDTAEYDSALLDLRLYDDAKGESPADQGSFRKVAPTEFFHQYLDVDSPGHAQEVEDLDHIERIVAPHGEALIKLYFRIVHPSFPILHKKVYLEKYGRTHREFSPPLLAAVYLLALNWWSYSTELARCTKPEISELESIAFRTLQDVSQRAKLSTVQAGLLLLQRSGPGSSWQLAAQLVAIGQDLGLHLDCSNWRIPLWERGLRKRLAWSLYMQDTWSALVHGRPPHIAAQNWAVPPVAASDFPESSADEDEEDGSTEVDKGRTLFSAMIALTKMLSEVLENLYSCRAEAEIRMAFDSTKAVLERAKPIQLKLRAWYADMPETLRMDNTRIGKLSSVGYLHLAYFATEITLHRRVIRSLSANTDPYLIQICRSAAKARLISAMDFFNRLKPEHLQSFWYFASKFNFALIGTFAGLCFVTSISLEEAEFYQRRLQEYRWTLRVSNKSAEFLEIASGILESAVGALLKAAEGIDSRRMSFPMLQHAGIDEEDEDEGEGMDGDEIDRFLANAENGFYEMSMET